MTAGDALRNLSIGVNSLKQATMIVSQVNFFIKHLNTELKQLNLLETRQGKDQKQTDGNSRFQSNQNSVRPRYQSFNNVQQSESNSQQAYQGFQNSQQQVAQNFQQGNQQGNQQKTVKISLFPCPLGCQHSVPWGSLSGCENFKAMAPQMRKDSVDKLRTTKCCLKKGGKQHDPGDCRTPLCSCGKAPPHHQLICPAERIQMTNIQPSFQMIECD